MTEIDHVLKHAQLAHFDNEVSSMIILMVIKGEPELHIALNTNAAEVFAMNAAVDMMKLEMNKLMHECMHKMQDRK